MTFFTPERMDRARSKHDPLVIELFESDYMRRRRDDIDRHLSVIPENARTAVCCKLERTLANYDNFVGRYNELVTGSLLFQLGFQVEYEPRIGVQTPDWRASDPADGGFILDVFERRSPKRSREARRFMCKVQSMLKDHPGPYWLSTRWQTVGRPPDVLPEPQVVADAIKHWLTTSPKPGDTLPLLEASLTVELSRVEEGRKVLGWFGPMESFFVTPKALGTKLAEKVRKYQAVAAQGSFVVAVMLDFATGLELPDLLKVLGGPEGVFCRLPELSGCLYVNHPGGAFDWITRYIANPHGSFPLKSPLLSSCTLCDSEQKGSPNE